MLGDKIKLLMVTDDIRLPSGVGGQARKLLFGLQKTGRYSITVIGGSLIAQPPDPIDVQGITVYPVSNGYGNQNQLRSIMAVTKPDIVIAFSDPRFFNYMFSIDNEIRRHSKFVLYHTWDNDPFPKFNMQWYAACDYVVTISKFSSELLTAGGIKNTCIQHGFDPQEIYPLKPDKVAAVRNEFAKALNKPSIGFLIFWNNRNLHRKRMEDVVMIFSKFYEKHPDSALLMNTESVNNEGNDLVHLLNDMVHPSLPVVLNFNRVNEDRLNEFYNSADVTLNIASQEGFGLCVGESLLAETPVIASKTGGMPEQMKSDTETFGLLIPASVRELFGVIGSPYIYKDYVNYEQVISALNNVYGSRTYFAEKGKKGREFIIKEFNLSSTIAKWNEFLIEVYNTPSAYKKHELSLVNEA
jgi:glycosyltransferase involved in cell wall biosynthesis